MANVDDATMDLILALQLQDINDLREYFAGAWEDLLLDSQLAMDFYREELSERARIINDHRFAESVGEGTNQDGLPAMLNPSATPLFDEAYDQHIRATIDPYEADFEDYLLLEDVPMETCAVCQSEETYFNVMIAPCGDTYCRVCVNELFDRTIKQEFNFPPKCCGKIITLEDAGLFLSSETCKEFQEKSEEFSTTNRTYCSKPECATFIPAEATDDDEAKCPLCHTLTCTVCKEGAHEGDCLEDPALQSLMTAAAEAGFQQCQECKRMIELSQGCYHITCTCGAEFCYLCGVQWKNCGCENWNEWNLLDEDGELDEAEEFDEAEEPDDAEEFNQREVDELIDYAVNNAIIHDDGRLEWRVPVDVAAAEGEGRILVLEHEGDEATPEALEPIDEGEQPGVLNEQLN